MTSQDHVCRGAQPIRVMVVDNSPAFIAALRGFLDRWSAVTVIACAADGREAVEQFEQDHPALVIMDVGMPRMNGMEAAAAIRRLSPDVRIIMVSIHVDRQTSADSLKSGADRFVPKIGIHRWLQSEICDLFPHLKRDVITE